MYTCRTFVLLIAAACLLHAQPKSDTDTIVFTNGDKLAGHFVRASSSTVIFKSDILGELTVEWSKVKELRTSMNVAVVPKGVKIRRRGEVDGIAEGTLVVENQTIQLTPPKSLPVSGADVIIDQEGYQKAMTRTPGFFSDWTGGITAGLTLVQATQNNRTFNGAVSLVRTEPVETWINPSNRTAITYSQTYGEITQPGTPTVKTSIFNADAQRDEYFKPTVFAFGEGSFDHNFSQGLDLQQTYNGGIGWSPVTTSLQTLNLKASMSYIRQQFSVGPSQNLIGSVFADDYTRKLPHGVLLTQRASVTPAWNNTNAYSAAFAALLTMPVYKHLSGSTGLINTYLNNPPPGFKKNSLQYILGLTYTIQ